MRAVSAVVVLVNIAVFAAADTVTRPHVRVEYSGIERNQAESIANVISTARQIYAEDFGADMPEMFAMEVEYGASHPTRLYTDGRDHIFLSLSSPKKLAPPAVSGVFNLYGFCHELGHVMMYRLLEERDWMTTAAAEGWAHYAGSVVADGIYAAKGESIWFEPYDYRADGTARLERQLAGERPSEVAQGAGLWRELERIIGRRGFAKLFRAWQAAGIDPAKPEEALLATAIKAFPQSEAALEAWWQKAAPLFVQPIRISRTEAEHVRADRLTGNPLELAYDDDASEGKRSIAGGGHARKFSAPGEDWYIRAVSVYGSRYGRPRESGKFDIALCDGEMQRIAVWKKPYMTFDRGPLRWVRMDVPPTRVPREFYICLDFQPTATKGVYVAYDDSTHGNSLVARPGQPGSPFEAGDWMIRIELDQLKEADALGD
jgi:hypothetical protein